MGHPCINSFNLFAKPILRKDMSIRQVFWWLRVVEGWCGVVGVGAGWQGLVRGGRGWCGVVGVGAGRFNSCLIVHE